jgi:hypothetical protein
MAQAQNAPAQPSAIGEDVQGAVAGLGVFDYLESGQRIALSVGDVLVLGYLGSCLRETIHGGEVTVGTTQSSVAGGLVIREEVECDGGSTELSAAEASQSGTIAFRQGPQQPGHGTRSNPIKIYSSDPTFVFSRAPSELVIRRLDRSERELRVPITGGRVSLADHGLGLAAGGLYKAHAGAQALVFELAPYAEAGGPLVGRLIRF